MSIFQDYAAKMRQTQTPFTGRLQQYTRDRWNPRQQSPLFNTERALAISPQAGQGVATTVDTTPQIDTGNAIASLAELMGPTPAEREAQQRRLQENKAKMAAWTGLFDGLRQIGNVIYTAKGATPQRFADPYQQIEQQYQGQRQLANEQNAYQRQYAQALYNLQRQANADKRQDALSKAQLEYYKTRDEQNARKMDLAEFKAKTDADYKKATLDQKNAINEVRIRLMEGQISKTEADRQYKLIMAGNAQAGTRTTTTKADGTVTTVVKEPNRNTGRRGSLLPGGKSKNTKQRGSLLPR